MAAKRPSSNPLPEWTHSAGRGDRPGSWAFQLALCLLGPIFFLSYLFSLLSPLPGLYLHAGTPDRARGRLWSAVALVLGCTLAAAIKGWAGALGFLAFASIPAFVLGELLLRKQGPVKAVLGATLAVLLAVTAFSWISAKSQGLELVPMVKSLVETQAKDVAMRLLTQSQSEISDPMREELERVQADPSLVVTELPGVAVAAVLLLVTLPCLALIRWNPKGFLRRAAIPRDYLRKWRAPEWLVWPSLLCAALLLFEAEYLSAIARNALKPILLIYFFQGMSILAFFLDSLRLRGPFRVIFYGLGILFATPMVVSFGFFDLWFNFRGRAKAQEEDKEP